MKRFRDIIVMAGGKDGGAAAIERAGEVARQNSAKVKIVDFVAPLPERLDMAGSQPAQIHAKLVDAKLENLNRIADPLREAGLKVVYELINGPAEKILERVISDGHDLLIKSAEQPPGFAQRLFGTTGLRIMRKCPCPVWIIKASAPKRFRRILAAIEPRPADQEREPLNVRIIEMATSLAQTDQAEVHVLYVWPDWATDSGPALFGEKESIQREIERLQASMLNMLLDPFRDEGHSFHTHLLSGDPGDTIVAQCQALEIELLLMGTIRGPNLFGFVMGSTAEKVLNQVNCSVLTLKPDDFSTFSS